MHSTKLFKFDFDFSTNYKNKKYLNFGVLSHLFNYHPFVCEFIEMIVKKTIAALYLFTWNGKLKKIIFIRRAKLILEFLEKFDQNTFQQN